MPDIDIIPAGALGAEGQESKEYAPATGDFSPETNSEAEEQGPDQLALFWRKQIEAAIIAERRWRAEGDHAETLYFGPDEDSGTRDSRDGKASNPISETTSTVHANIEVLKPMIFSETPTPIVQRRFRGDGKKTDETDLMATEVGQRLSQWILSTSRFDRAMEGVRDDWLIPGRGAARAFYKAEFSKEPVIDPVTGVPIIGVDGQPVLEDRKTGESVYTRRWEWRRLLLAPGHSWDRMPWIAFEVPMTRTQIEQAFPDKVDNIRYNNPGMIDRSRALGDSDKQSVDMIEDTMSSGEMHQNPFDTATVWEVWNKDTREVIWWSPDCMSGVLDKQEDPLQLEDFWPMPRPLLATTKGESLIPRPDIRYYEAAAEEVELATKKMEQLLKVIAVKGLFPGQMADTIKKLLDGQHGLHAVESWIALMDKGGTREMIQWLPLDVIITCIQALAQLREQAKQRMFEASGVSDIMRAQGDPRETATAQNLKGKFAGMRLSSKQHEMAVYARDMLRILVEMAVEMFDTSYIADITSLDLPITEADRAAMQAEQDATKQAFAAATQEYEAAQAQRQAIEQAAQAQGGQVTLPPLAPPPPPPPFERIPETSYELVHDRLRNDLSRKITISIETQSTLLADEAGDKEARIEFLSAFSTFLQQIVPMIDSGQFDMKTAKELLLFGVRAFPKSRTLEGMISSLPDEPKKAEKAPDVQVQVAKIRAEVDLEIEKMRMADHEAERAQDMKMKGADLMVKAAEKAGETPTAPQQ